MTARVLSPLSYAGVDVSQSADLIRAHFDSVGPNLLPPQYDQRLARVAGGWPRALDPQPLERTLELQVRLMIAYDGTADADLQEFKRIFSPRKGQQTLVATDGTNDWELEASVLRMAHQNGVLDTWVVTLQAADGLWRKTTDSIQPTTISGATTASIDATTIGNELSPAVVAVTPTSIKGQAADQRYRSQQTVAWRAARGAARYPIALTLDTATEVTAGRMLGTGDDLDVLVDGRKVDRWLGAMNTGATKVWVLQDFSPARSGALRAAITAGGPATGGSLELEDAGDLPSTGIAEWGTEAISWLMKSSDGRTLLGITRSVRGTIAATHAAGDVGYLVTRQVDLIWGYSGAAAPVRDADTEPLLDLAASDNGTWAYEEFASASGRRPMEWTPMLLGDNPSLITMRSERSVADYPPTTNAGGNQDGVITGAATYWQAVNTDDSDTSYVTLAVVDDYLVFKANGLPEFAPGAILSIRVRVRARKIGAGNAALQAVVRQVGVGAQYSNSTSIGVADFNPTTSYTTYYFPWALNPRTDAPWTAGDLANFEWGIRMDEWAAGGDTRITYMALEVSGILAAASDPADSIAIYKAPSVPVQDHPNRDAWSVATPCGVSGTDAISGTSVGGGVADAQMTIWGYDSIGQLIQVDSGDWNLALTGAVDVTTSPAGPLYTVGIRSLSQVSDGAWAGFALRDMTLLFDPDATPMVVAAVREDVYVARFTLENETTEQTIEVLYPMAIGATLTIDADAGTVTYSLPSYNPLPAVSFDAPRIPWLELEAGENDLVWTDLANGAAGLGLSLRWRDRRS